MNNEVLKKGFKKAEQYKYLLIVVAAGIILLLLPPFSGSTKTPEQPVEPELFSISAEEARIGRALSAVAGVGKTEVILTLRSTMESIYQLDTNDKSTTSADQSDNNIITETVIISQGSGIEQAVVIKKIYPEYKGALVICEGASSTSVQLKVINAVRALTGLSTEKITVLSRRSN